MAYLQDLAGGLRAAAGVLSPDVQRQTAEEDQRNQLLRQQQAQMLVTTLAKQVADGTITPEAARAATSARGLNVPPEMFGGPPIETQVRKKALENEAGFRSAIQSSGGDIGKIAAAAMQYGKPEVALKMYDSAEERIRKTQEAKDKLEQRAEEFRLRMEDKAASREQQAQYQQMMLSMRQQANNLSAQIAQGNQQLRGMQMQLMNDQREDRRSQFVDRAVTSFANELQQNKLPSLTSSITAANDMLKKYTDKDIPGLGVVVGSKYVPGPLRTEEAKNVRSSLQAVTNDLLNLYSGLAVTLPESERRELEEMRNGQFTSKDFKNAWPRIVARYNTVLGNMRASASPAVLERYQSRPGALKLDPITPAFSQGNGWSIKEK